MGNFLYLRIWHDNSGKGDAASWFLKLFIVHDLQTREKSYFVCENWLAVDTSDGMIERILPITTRKQKTQIKFLLEKNTKASMSDNHLWFSIFARPIMSSFNRTERLTCCFVLLFSTMLMNIMYYDQDKSTTRPGDLVVGPFTFTQSQVHKQKNFAFNKNKLDKYF